MKFGLSFKKIREELGVSQEEVAGKAKISQAHLSRIENGWRNPSSAIFNKLCKIYNVPPVAVVWLCTSEKDVIKSKRFLYRKLKPIIDGLVNELIRKN